MARNEKNDRNKTKREFKIPEDAKRLCKLSMKKFKKENKDFYESKKELKKAYYAQIIDLLPEGIALVVKYGHLEAVKETKTQIYEKITDPEFVKYLKKELKKNDCDFRNKLLLPIIIKDIVAESEKAIAAMKEENPDSTVEFDLSDLVEISGLILEPKIKKLKKAGIEEGLAFDILSAIPTPEILKKSPYFHIRTLFTILYEHAKTKDIDFDKLMKAVFKKNEEYIPSVITFALLERKEKIGNFTDSQKKLFNDITEYCFKVMEDMKKDDITAILKAYCDARKRDAAQNKDTNRRYYISSLPESDYPTILKVVSKMTDANEDIKQYF